MQVSVSYLYLWAKFIKDTDKIRYFMKFLEEDTDTQKIPKVSYLIGILSIFFLKKIGNTV
jgi:hypothetical protein